MKQLHLFSVMTLIFAAANAHAGSAALRIVCDGEAEGAVVSINGKVKGECPLDMKVPEGKLSLRAQKNVNGEVKSFEQNLLIGDGVMKKVEVDFRSEVEKMRAAWPNYPEMIAIPGKSYEMGKYEVTQAQWRDVMGSDPSPDFVITQCGKNCPVSDMTWYDIQEFLAKLNQKTGKKFRLPTNEEWEYACYGGNQTTYCGGNDIDAVAWYEENTPKTRYGGSIVNPIGRKRPNGYGLYDMSGNLAEYLENCNGSNCEEHLVRGGAFTYHAENMKAAQIYARKKSESNPIYGFRLARTLP